MSSLETLRGFVTAADLDGLAAWLGDLPARERKALEKPVTKGFREREHADGPGHPALTRTQVAALWLAGFALGLPFAAREVWSAPDAAQVAALCPMLRPTGVDAFVERILPGWWRFAVHLVEGGHAARPPERLWALGMLGVADSMRFDGRDDLVDRWSHVFVRDIRLFFLHEGENQNSLSAFSGHRWAEKFRAWADQGRLDRQLLLDLCLDALASGWAAGRQPALTQMFDGFEPTPAELAVREPAFTRLLHNAAPATVGWALAHLGAAIAAGRVPPEALGAAALCKTVKTARAALDGLAQLAATVPDQRDAAIDAANEALMHPDPRVQEQVVDLLDGWGVDVHARVAPFLDALAPSVRARMSTSKPPSQAGLPPPPPPIVSRPIPLDPSRAIGAFDGDDHALIDALVPACADASDVDLAERLLAALAVRPRPTDPAVLAHARAARAAWRRARVGREGAPPGAMLATVALAWGCGEAPEPLERAGWEGFPVYAERSIALASAVLDGPVAWMSLPTHRMGHLDPRVLVARWAERADRPVLDVDLALALLRVEPGLRAEALTALPDDHDPRTGALRWALGGSAPTAIDARLAAVAAHVRNPAEPDVDLLTLVPELARGVWRVQLPRPAFLVREGRRGQVLRTFATPRPPSHPGGDGWWDDAPTDAERDTRRDLAGILAWLPRLDANLESGSGAAAWARALWAGNPDHYANVALEAVVGRFGGTYTDTRQPSALAALFEDVRPLGPVGALVLAAGLCSGHASVRLAAVDLFVACATDGRLEVGPVADALADFLREGFYPPGRLARSLPECAAAGPVAHDAALAVGLATLRPSLVGTRDLGRLIAALHELRLARPCPLPEPARDLSARSKGRDRVLIDG